MFTVQSLPYRSPLIKLVRVFRKSRDQWKMKCQAAKRENKSLKHRLANTRISRNRWKAKTRQAASIPEKDSPSPADPECKRCTGPSAAGRQLRDARFGIPHR